MACIQLWLAARLSVLAPHRWCVAKASLRHCFFLTFSKYFWFICHHSWPLSVQFWREIHLGGRRILRLLGSWGCISGARRTRLEGEINICFYLSNKDWLLLYLNCDTLDHSKSPELWIYRKGSLFFLKIKHQVFSTIFGTYCKSNRNVKLVYITQNNDNLEHFINVNFDQKLLINVKESD